MLRNSRRRWLARGLLHELEFLLQQPLCEVILLAGLRSSLRSGSGLLGSLRGLKRHDVGGDGSIERNAVAAAGIHAAGGAGVGGRDNERIASGPEKRRCERYATVSNPLCSQSMPAAVRPVCCGV